MWEMIKAYSKVIDIAISIIVGLAIFYGGYKLGIRKYETYKLEVEAHQIATKNEALTTAADIEHKVSNEFSAIETKAKAERNKNAKTELKNVVPIDMYRGVVSALDRLRNEVANDYGINKAEFTATPSRSATNALIAAMRKRNEALRMCINEYKIVASGTATIIDQCGKEYQELAKRADDDRITLQACQATINVYTAAAK